MVALARLALPAIADHPGGLAAVRTEARAGRADVRRRRPRPRLARRRRAARPAPRAARGGAPQHRARPGFDAGRARRRSPATADGQARRSARSAISTRPPLSGARRAARIVRASASTCRRVCAALLHDGEVDLGLIPSIEYLQRTTTRSCRASPSARDGAVASVALFTRRPIERVRRIALDTSSRTSVGADQVLCRHHFRIAPAFVPHGAGSRRDARDDRRGAAHRRSARSTRRRGARRDKIDLGAVWTEMTGLPFVYAVWTGRPARWTTTQVRGAAGCRRRGERAGSPIAAEQARGDLRVRTPATSRTLRDNCAGYRAERAGRPPVCGGSSRSRSSGRRRAGALRPLRFYACQPDAMEQLHGPNRATAAGVVAPPRRFACIATRRRTCSAASPTRSARASIPRASSPTSSTATSTTRTSASRAATSARSIARSASAKATSSASRRSSARSTRRSRVGGNQLLLQGGHNPDLPIAWYEDLFRAVKARYPSFKLHALSPPEVLHISRLSKLPAPR